jgi:exodeoxyribonuclease VII large subunit
LDHKPIGVKPNNDSGGARKIYTVSQLTAVVKNLLEQKFALIWITGEISNFRVPGSGHYYFTLKDADAQINTVMFRGQNRNLKFMPEDGMSVTGFGRISVYELRGVYQMILEYLEPSGIGALQAAFEQLKARLSAEGLFDAVHKKPIPFLPRRICLITSPTGAVVHDMIRVIQRRFENVAIDILPVKVQGAGAEADILSALNTINAHPTADVAILARGGGSLEDLAVFNTESVARAIFASAIPIISAVGHETDFTIADFVADLRAPTPSAAAELVVPVKSDLKHCLVLLNRRMDSGCRRFIQSQRNCLEKLTRRLVHPRKKVDDYRLRIDDVTARLYRRMDRYIRSRNEKLSWRVQRLYATDPRRWISVYRDRVSGCMDTLIQRRINQLNTKRMKLQMLNGRLHALSPAAVLDRGFSIARLIPGKTIITDARNIDEGRLIEILLARGSLTCRVERKTINGQENL